MIDFKSIQDVHLEISTLCNASCPWCPRTFWGYPFNGGYPEVYMTLDQSKKIFSPEFLRQLVSIRINGNFGDIVMNPDGADIVEYFKNQNPKLKISVHTNGGARNKEFWNRLAQADSQVIFAIDGLEDTHHLYRQNTVWSTVIKNAKIFIASGGHAIWQMISFSHNLHQIQECKKLSQEWGFREFRLVDDGRNTAPVFDQNGNLTHTIGDYQGEREFKVLFHKKKTDEVILEDIIAERSPKSKISCQTKNMKSIYIASNGDVSPCCFTGFYPATYGQGQYHRAANKQLEPFIHKNNALEHPLHECIEWFRNVERSWGIDQYQNGRLIICDDQCGSD